jgi:hypothetical protein
MQFTREQFALPFGNFDVNGLIPAESRYGQLI